MKTLQRKKPRLRRQKRSSHSNWWGRRAYRKACDRSYRPIDLHTPEPFLREIARYATMAPNSHNTQPWKMTIEDSALVIRVDDKRRCPVVDPDDHHIFVSLGCAVENAVQAAAAYELHSEVNFIVEENAVRIDFSKQLLQDRLQKNRALFKAVPVRQSTRGNYDGTKVTQAQLRKLLEAGSSAYVEMMLFTRPPEMEAILKMVIEANCAQMETPGFVKELKKWIRMSYADAVEHSDGLFGKTSGSPAIPTVVPAWLGERIFDRAFTPEAESKKYERLVHSSAGIAVFVGASDTAACWVEVGRCFERFALLSTSMGILHSHLNQSVEVPGIRAALGNFIGAGKRLPDLVVRFGHGKPLPKSLRRPLTEVME